MTTGVPQDCPCSIPHTPKGWTLVPSRFNYYGGLLAAELKGGAVSHLIPPMCPLSPTIPVNIPTEQLEMSSHTVEGPASLESQREGALGSAGLVLLQGLVKQKALLPFLPRSWGPRHAASSAPQHSSLHCGQGPFSFFPVTKLLPGYVFTGTRLTHPRWQMANCALFQLCSQGLTPGITLSCCCLVFATRQAPLPMGFSWQEYWSGSPFPSPGDLPDPGIELKSLALASRFFTTEPPGKPITLRGCPQTQQSREIIF